MYSCAWSDILRLSSHAQLCRRCQSVPSVPAQLCRGCRFPSVLACTAVQRMPLLPRPCMHSCASDGHVGRPSMHSCAWDGHDTPMTGLLMTIPCTVSSSNVPPCTAPRPRPPLSSSPARPSLHSHPLPAPSHPEADLHAQPHARGKSSPPKRPAPVSPPIAVAPAAAQGKAMPGRISPQRICWACRHAWNDRASTHWGPRTSLHLRSCRKGFRPHEQSSRHVEPCMSGTRQVSCPQPESPERRRRHAETQPPTTMVRPASRRSQTRLRCPP